jgi:hypothetical protein
MALLCPLKIKIEKNTHSEKIKDLHFCVVLHSFTLRAMPAKLRFAKRRPCDTARLAPFLGEWPEANAGHRGLCRTRLRRALGRRRRRCPSMRVRFVTKYPCPILRNMIQLLARRRLRSILGSVGFANLTCPPNPHACLQILVTVIAHKYWAMLRRGLVAEGDGARFVISNQGLVALPAKGCAQYNGPCYVVSGQSLLLLLACLWARLVRTPYLWASNGTS